MDDEIFERICSIIVGHLGIEPGRVVHATSFIDDLEVDSLDAIELIMAFEDAFDIAIPDHAAETLITVHDAIDYVERKLESRRRGNSDL